VFLWLLFAAVLLHVCLIATSLLHICALLEHHIEGVTCLRKPVKDMLCMSIQNMDTWSSCDHLWQAGGSPVPLQQPRRLHGLYVVHYVFMSVHYVFMSVPRAFASVDLYKRVPWNIFSDVFVLS